MAQQTTAGQRPAEREFEPPVGWLLGQQLLAGLKWIALYASYGEKLDARDWMRAEPPGETTAQYTFCSTCCSQRRYWVC